MRQSTLAIALGLAMHISSFQFSIAQPSKANAPGCLPKFTSYYYTTSLHSSNPPLSTSMPLDVLIGYIALDSASRVSGTGYVDSISAVRPMNDTILMMMKYAYEVVDYDPIRFLSYSYDFRSGISCAPNTIRMGMNTVIAKHSTNLREDLILLTSDIIAKVRITAVENIIDSGAKRSRDARIIGFTVVDTIKGRVLPNICAQITSSVGSVPTSQSTGPGTCQYFDVRTDWAESIMTKPILDSTLRIGRELYVGLHLSVVCIDSAHVYFTLIPTWNSTLGLLALYPVDSAKHTVYIHRNTFGLVGWVSESQFNAAMATGISRILNP